MHSFPTPSAEPVGGSLLDYALWYATACHWPVFPCRPRSKTPLTQHGFKEATTDPAQIRRWWRAHPAANIALAIPPGVVVVDIDVKPAEGKDGRLWAAAHTDLLPPTLTNWTSGGGYQLFYEVPRDLPIRQAPLAPGVDVRAPGRGYVLLPPSVHPSGSGYRWEGHPGDA